MPKAGLTFSAKSGLDPTALSRSSLHRRITEVPLPSKFKIRFRGASQNETPVRRSLSRAVGRRGETQRGKPYAFSSHQLFDLGRGNDERDYGPFRFPLSFKATKSSSNSSKANTSTKIRTRGHNIMNSHRNGTFYSPPMPADPKRWRIVRLPEVKTLTGLSRSTLYDRMRAGSFPHTVRLGGRLVGWFESDICSWIESRQGKETHRPYAD